MYVLIILYLYILTDGVMQQIQLKFMEMSDVVEVAHLAWAVPLACLLPSDLKADDLSKAKTLPVSLDGNSLHFLCASGNKGLTSELVTFLIIDIDGLSVQKDIFQGLKFDVSSCSLARTAHAK